MNTDIVIIGAGPAGLACALSLKKYGENNVIVVEKDTFPRYKCCAGYITNKTKKKYEHYGLDLSNAHYSLIEDFNIFYKQQLKQTIINKFLYTNEKIDRVELDYEFYKLAKKEGISILENSHIKNIDIDESKILLDSDKVINYKYIIFADGTSSIGHKYNKKFKKKNIAMQAIIQTNRPISIEIHFGITPKGYAWISSYNGITNIGFTDVYDKTFDYNKLLVDFAKQQGIAIEQHDIKGCFTPIGLVNPQVNNMYYIGDAVGACDPFTLSGLRYALQCGDLVAKSITSNKPQIYRKYIKNLSFKFEILKIIQKVFYMPGILFLVFNVGCKYFSRLISYLFNCVFVQKK